MKKMIQCTLILICISCTVLTAQTGTTQTGTSTTTTTTTTTTVASHPIKLGGDMMINVPKTEAMIYSYEIDAADVKFNNIVEKEKYFNSLNDEVVTYTYDTKNDKIYMRLNNNYIDNQKWTNTEVNSYFKNRSTYMKDQYGNYMPPAGN